MDFDLDLSTDVLRRTPATLQTLLGGLAERLIRAVEGPETFSPFDVVGHLIDGEETDWIPRARIILACGPNLQFESYDRFRHRARNVNRSLESLLEEFAQLRAGNLEVLRAWQLTPSDLELPGIHPSLGPVTLRQLLAAWVVHDLGHLAQVSRVMAKQYRDAVGPWVPFLPVLTDHEVPRSWSVRQRTERDNRQDSQEAPFSSSMTLTLPAIFDNFPIRARWKPILTIWHGGPDDFYQQFAAYRSHNLREIARAAGLASGRGNAQ